MLKLMEQEEEVIKRVRKAEDEVSRLALSYNKIFRFSSKTRDLQFRRQQEDLSNELEVSVYDTDRNEKSKIYRELLVSKYNCIYLELIRI